MTTITLRGRDKNALETGGVARIHTPIGRLRIQLESEGDTVVVERRHLRTLHQAAQTYASPSVRRALEETEHLV